MRNTIQADLHYLLAVKLGSENPRNLQIVITDHRGEEVRVEMAGGRRAGGRFWLVGCLAGGNIPAASFVEVNIFVFIHAIVIILNSIAISLWPGECDDGHGGRSNQLLSSFPAQPPARLPRGCQRTWIHHCGGNQSSTDEQSVNPARLLSCLQQAGKLQGLDLGCKGWQVPVVHRGKTLWLPGWKNKLCRHLSLK